MKKLGNVLFILTPQTYLFCRNETIALRVGGEEKIVIPAHTVESIVCLAETIVSTPFIGFCGERGIGLSFCSEYGKFFGRIYGPINGNVLLRKKQYENISTSIGKELVRCILFGKFASGRNVIMRAARDNDDDIIQSKLYHAADQISEAAALLDTADTIDSMRGIEGAAATAYFSVFDFMLKKTDEDMKFVVRSKRPPQNKVNALLSFLYMLLKNDMQNALETVGLDPAAGYLHTLRPGRPSLALDMMEELRAPLCDRLAISLINTKVITSTSFGDSMADFRMTDKARRNVIDSWQKRKKEIITHPFLEEKIPIGLIPYCQSMLLARYLRGDLDKYPPFMWR